MHVVLCRIITVILELSIFLFSDLFELSLTALSLNHLPTDLHSKFHLQPHFFPRAIKVCLYLSIKIRDYIWVVKFVFICNIILMLTELTTRKSCDAIIACTCPQVCIQSLLAIWIKYWEIFFSDWIISLSSILLSSKSFIECQYICLPSTQWNTRIPVPSPS